MGKKIVAAFIGMWWCVFCLGCRETTENPNTVTTVTTTNTTTTCTTTQTTVSTTTTNTTTKATTQRKILTTVKPTTKTTTTSVITSASTSTAATKQDKDQHLIQGVPLICQFPEFPSGCESVASVMALQYAGEKISVTRFIDSYLNTGAVYRKDGVLYGPDPYKSFVGDPRSQYALGCYAPVIENALVRYFGDAARVKNTTGETFDTLCERYIAHNVPVLVWVSIYMKDTGQGNVWYTQDGKRFQWITNEHCMLLVGYDEGGYYFNDPYSGKQLYYDKQLSARRYETFGRQSLVIIK